MKRAPPKQERTAGTSNQLKGNASIFALSAVFFIKNSIIISKSNKNAVNERKTAKFQKIMEVVKQIFGLVWIVSTMLVCSIDTEASGMLPSLLVVAGWFVLTVVNAYIWKK